MGEMHKKANVWPLGQRRTVANQPITKPVQEPAEQSEAGEFRCALDFWNPV